MHKWRYGNSIYNSMHDQMDNNRHGSFYGDQYEEKKINDNTLNEHTRIIQRNVILVTGLSSKLCDKHLLKSNQWFGKYGDIKQIYIDYWNKWVFIMYLYRESAVQAINEMNNYRLRNGKQINVNHGINKYCKYFLNFRKCPYKNCVNVHHIANMDDLILNENDTYSPNHNNHNFSLNEAQNEYFSNSESSTNSEQNQIDILQSKLDLLQHENDKLKQENATLKNQIKTDPETPKDSEISRLKQENIKKSQMIQRLKRNMKSMQNDYLAEIEELEHKLQEIQSQLKPPKLVKYNTEYYENIQLKNDLRFQEVQYRLLQSSYYRVIYELESVKDHKKNKYQKYKTKFAKLQNKYFELKEKTGYKSWDWLDCYEWFVTVRNNKFSIYNEELSIKLKQENIDGLKLERMTYHDLKRIGIESDQDRVILLHEIKKLITGNIIKDNNNNNDQNGDIEGNEGYNDNDHTYDLEGDD